MKMWRDHTIMVPVTYLVSAFAFPFLLRFKWLPIATQSDGFSLLWHFLGFPAGVSALDPGSRNFLHHFQLSQRTIMRTIL